MDIALTLVVNPEYATSLTDAEKAARDLIGDKQVSKAILAADVAIDLLFDAEDATDCKSLFAPLKSLEGLDWAVQPAKGRKKKMILADMDSTMITVECIDELADFVGVKDKVSQITEAAMRGELDFEGALTERVALLQGLTDAQLGKCFEERIELMAGARTLIQTMKANDAYTALVSGGFTYFTEKVASEIGFDMNRANVLEVNDGALTGKVVPPICGAQTKLDTLNELAGRYDLSKQDIAAVGDGANDIPMLEAASLGVAYHAHPKTREAAGFAVTYGDLATLLYFQGYKKSEFHS